MTSGERTGPAALPPAWGPGPSAAQPLTGAAAEGMAISRFGRLLYSRPAKPPQDRSLRSLCLECPGVNKPRRPTHTPPCLPHLKTKRKHRIPSPALCVAWTRGSGPDWRPEPAHGPSPQAEPRGGGSEVQAPPFSSSWNYGYKSGQMKGW